MFEADSDPRDGNLFSGVLPEEVENGRRDSSLHFFCREENGFHDRMAFCWFLSTFTVLLMLNVEAFSVIFAVSRFGPNRWKTIFCGPSEAVETPFSKESASWISSVMLIIDVI